MKKEELQSILAYESKTGVFRFKKNNKIAGSINSNGYLIITINKNKYRAHRIAFLFVHGYLPTLIDHRDKNKLNNSIDNLRDCTPSENQYNTNIQTNNKSGVKGVFFRKSKNRWIAQIKHNYKNIHIGSFIDKESAEKARIKEELKIRQSLERYQVSFYKVIKNNMMSEVRHH